MVEFSFFAFFTAREVGVEMCIAWNKAGSCISAAGLLSSDSSTSCLWQPNEQCLGMPQTGSSKFPIEQSPNSSLGLLPVSLDIFNFKNIDA